MIEQDYGVPAGERRTSRSGKPDNIVYYPVLGGNIKFDKATGTVTGCEQYVTEAKIPKMIEGVPVTSIGCGAFEYSSVYLTSIIIPDSVTTIDKRAFCECRKLRKVIIPNTVTSIGSYAFYACEGLTCITIPKSVTSIGLGAFYDCNGLQDVYYGGTRAEYEARLLPNIEQNNDRFQIAAFHFKEDKAPAASNHTARFGTIFLLLAALTVYTLGWAVGKMSSSPTK